MSIIKKFNIKIFSTAFLLLVAIFLICRSNQLPVTVQQLSLIPIIGLFISLLSFYVAKSNKASGKPNIMVTALFGIKFFSYFILVVIYFVVLKEKSARFIIIITVFVVYSINTVILLSHLLKYLKEKNL